jgi:putative nucleotidyltransferase with HDIG domain
MSYGGQTRDEGRDEVKSEPSRAEDRSGLKRARVILLAETSVLAAGLVIAALSSRASEWSPAYLVALLLVLAIGSEAMTIELRRVRMSGSFLALVLAMALLGPAPAAAIGAVSVLADDIARRRSLRDTLWNAMTFVAFPLAGGWIIRLATAGAAFGGSDALGFAALVGLVYMLMNAANFGSVALYLNLTRGMRFRDSWHAVYVTVLPFEFATALLTAAVAFSYSRIGVGAVGLLAVVLFVFQYLIRAGVQAYERGIELQRRTKELASLQVGLLSTVLQTLSMRDAMTARHSAAVARYSREVARMLGLSEREQELIHTAALLHDIGKFILPDSVLFADRKLTDEEWELIKLHPEQGARLVERIEGYGPVAEIVLHHHERFSGGGYPTGIAGEEIPLGSRIISAADTYDVMTSRDSYRRPVSSEAALAELRRVSGTQLDPQVVEVFERMILERRVKFSHTDAADFESELNFERRVADYARPRIAA